MESHVALNTGIFTAMVDVHESGSKSTVKYPEDLNANQKIRQTGAATYIIQNFNRNALLTPVTGRGTTFDILL